MLVSHLHHDHLDKPSLRRVASAGHHRRAARPAPRSCSTRCGFGAIEEVRAGETITVGGTEIHVVPAWHDGRRRPGPGALELDTLGFVVDGVWFAGDTDLNESMRALHGEVDVALIPIWGWGPSLGPGHLDPEGAAKAVALVEPRIAIPIHWGTFLPIGYRRRHDDPQAAAAGLRSSRRRAGTVDARGDALPRRVADDRVAGRASLSAASS